MIDNEWKTIGKVKGNGNSLMVNNYSFIDNTILLNNEQNSTLNYRLKQVDFNGDFVYSEIISISSQLTDKSISISPVPMQNLLSVSTAINEVIETISIYDINAKLVLKANNEANIDVSKLLNGVYTIKIITDKQTFIGKIVK